VSVALDVYYLSVQLARIRGTNPATVLTKPVTIIGLPQSKLAISVQDLAVLADFSSSFFFDLVLNKTLVPQGITWQARMPQVQALPCTIAVDPT
jgi:hypothetical protein